MAKKRGPGEGNYYQRADGLWVGRISLGFGPGGKRRRLVVYGATMAEAREKLEKKKLQKTTGVLAEAHKLTAGDFLETWLVGTAKKSVEATTWERYEQLVRLYGKPYFAHVRLDRLTAFTVDEKFNTMERDGVTAWNRRMTLMVLSYALDYAVRPLKLIPYNPCAGVAKAVPDEKDIRILGPDEVKKFFETIKGNRLEALFVLALASGMRQGELLGLYWCDIDFDAGTVSVRRSLTNLKDGGFTLKPPKTKRSRRAIDLPAFALDALHDHRKRMLAEGKAVQGEAKVFCTRTANWIAKSNLIRYTFKPLLQKAGLPAIRFHDLRHTHASNLLQKRMPVEDVSARLGHASVTTTYKVYSHLIPKSGNDAARVLQDLFG